MMVIIDDDDRDDDDDEWQPATARKLWQIQPEDCTKATARRLWQPQPESCGRYSPKTVPSPQPEGCGSHSHHPDDNHHCASSASPAVSIIPSISSSCHDLCFSSRVRRAPSSFSTSCSSYSLHKFVPVWSKHHYSIISIVIFIIVFIIIFVFIIISSSRHDNHDNASCAFPVGSNRTNMMRNMIMLACHVHHEDAW